jgi:hypothetical protein
LLAGPVVIRSDFGSLKAASLTREQGLEMPRPPTKRPSCKRDDQPYSDQGAYASNDHAETNVGLDAVRMELGLFAAHCASDRNWSST